MDGISGRCLFLPENNKKGDVRIHVRLLGERLIVGFDMIAKIENDSL